MMMQARPRKAERPRDTPISTHSPSHESAANRPPQASLTERQTERTQAATPPEDPPHGSPSLRQPNALRKVSERAIYGDLGVFVGSKAVRRSNDFFGARDGAWLVGSTTRPSSTITARGLPMQEYVGRWACERSEVRLPSELTPSEFQPRFDAPTCQFCSDHDAGWISDPKRCAQTPSCGSDSHQALWLRASSVPLLRRVRRASVCRLSQSVPG